MQAIVGLVLGVTYGLTRYCAFGNLGESISTGVLFAVFYVLVAWRVQARALSDWRKLVTVELNPWLNLLVAVAVVVVGLIRFDTTFAGALFDGVFAFAFFTPLQHFL